MAIYLSKTEILSFCGDVLPLRLLSDTEELTHAAIRWSASDARIGIRTFEGEGPLQIHNGILLILKEEGTAVVTAEYAGETYTCAVTVRAAKKASSEDPLNYYIGDMHDHTSTIHSPDLFADRESGFQIDYLNYINDENKMDIGVISDHAGTINDRDFFQGFIDEESLQPMNVVVFPGAESEVSVTAEDRFGVLRRHSGEIVTINTAGYADAATWQEFYDIFEGSPEPVAIFAHPHVLGYSTNGIWNFCFHKNNTPEMLRVIRGVEMGNGGDRATNLLHEYALSDALDHGFRVSTTCSSDSHEIPWGYDCMPGKTVVMAPEKSKEAFLDALRNNRFYGCESGNIKLKYTVNGKTAPCDLPKATTYQFHLELSYFKEDPTTAPIKCQVLSDKGLPVAVFEGEDFSSFDFEVESDTARYFYLRLMDREGRKTWSPPVWTGRAFDQYQEPAIEPMDMNGFTAIDAATGADAAVAINGAPFESWMTGRSTASILIDMKEERELCALGYLPHIIMRPKDKTIVWAEADDAATLPARYSVSVSRDGEHFEQCAAGISRVFGGENIIEFPACRARYLRFDVLSNVGDESGVAKYANRPVRIGNLSLFTAKK